MSTEERGTRQANRLIREKSPYLLQHAYNPVDWYPWGDEAFAKARQEQKPVFLSIGYSTCHWCHVMERESFENPEIAELLNRWFVSIKVDREEHPDVDQVYMDAVMMLTGRGGWPLTAFLTPERKPFFGGTYFPPERRWDIPGMREVLPSVAQAWERRREELTKSAEEITAALSKHLAQTGAAQPARAELLDGAFQQASRAFDPAAGGFGEAPKFPRSHELSFLLRYWARRREPRALEMAASTLDHMARGGLHDHLGGGFHRYSTDAHWLVPHFEKMLYDQALLAMTFLEAHRATQRADFAQTASGILDYVLRDLADPAGGFYSAEDADSEGHEGTFYAWTPEQVLEALGPEDGALFNRTYGVTAGGHFEGGSVLHLQQPVEAAMATRLADARARLFAARSRRPRPHRDDKILTSWNGLMIAALAYGGATLGQPRYVDAAERAAAFVLRELARDGRLLRRYRDGEALYPGTLEDYAFLAHGLLELYAARFDPQWLEAARRLGQEMTERFWDPDAGGFFLRARDEEPLIVRSKEVYDGATPSGYSMAAGVLLRLGRLLAEGRFEDAGRKAIEAVSERVHQAPFGYPQLLIAVDIALGPTQEIVIAGEPSEARTAALSQEVHRRFLPRAVTALHPSSGPWRGRIEALAPYVKAHEPRGGAPAAYVCESYVCQAPVTDPSALAKLLDAAAESPAR